MLEFVCGCEFMCVSLYAGVGVWEVVFGSQCVAVSVWELVCGT